MSQRFVIVVRDGNGTGVDTSHYEPDSLLAAADFGHALQRQSGCTVMVIDKSEEPYEEYSINGRVARPHCLGGYSIGRTIRSSLTPQRFEPPGRNSATRPSGTRHCKARLFSCLKALRTSSVFFVQHCE